MKAQLPSVGDLVGAHRHLRRVAEPSHHKARADEGRGFEEHLERDRKPDAEELPYGAAREVAQREAREVAAVAVAAAEVADHQYRSDDAREQRAHARAHGAHFAEPEVAVDEQPVEPDVGDIGDDRHRHLDLRVAHPFEELLEGEEEHQEGHADHQQPVVGDGHADHVDGLSEPVEQRRGDPLREPEPDAQQRVEDDGVLQQIARSAAVALCVEFADEGREAQRDAHRRDEDDEEDRAAERHGGQRRGIVAAVAADHYVVGELREDLPQLRQHDGQGQPEVGLVLRFIGCEAVHRFCVSGCKGSK